MTVEWKRKLAAAVTAVALVFVAPTGSRASADPNTEGQPDSSATDVDDGASNASPFEFQDPFDGLDLSDPIAAREEVQRRLGETEDAAEVLTELVRVGSIELWEAAERSNAANEWLESALAEAESARTESEQAEEDAEAASRAAVKARDDARDALVAAYISPPSHDTSRALVSVSDMNDSFFLHGLLSSRASTLTEVVARADRAEEAAEIAAEEAESAAVTAEAAAAEATAAASIAAAAAEESGSRLADLQLFQALLDAQVTSLEVVDVFLERMAVGRFFAANAASGPPVAFSDVAVVPGTSIRVHRSVVEVVSAMVATAAADGVVLDGFGWRTVETQISLRRAHCGTSPERVFLAPASSCSPPTARPGSSMHERGLAIDFSDCWTRSTVCYQWLSHNAHRFGFYNLPSEPWHWSVNGN